MSVKQAHEKERRERFAAKIRELGELLVSLGFRRSQVGTQLQIVETAVDFLHNQLAKISALRALDAPTSNAVPRLGEVQPPSSSASPLLPFSSTSPPPHESLPSSHSHTYTSFLCCRYGAL